MKNIFKFLGIVTFVAAIGFSFTACGDSGSGDNGGNGNGGNGGNVNTGNILKITDAQLYTMNYNTQQGNFEYVPYNGTVTDLIYMPVYNDLYTDEEPEYLPINDIFDGAKTVTVINGKLSVNFGTPKSSVMYSTSTLKAKYPSLTISSNDAKLFSVSIFVGRIDSPNNVYNIHQDYMSETTVGYMYSNKNVTINGTTIENSGDGIYTARYSMDLKTGWNSIVQTETQTSNGNYEVSVKTGNPTTSIKWIIDGNIN
jgi:hypothetical protein